MMGLRRTVVVVIGVVMVASIAHAQAILPATADYDRAWSEADQSVVAFSLANVNADAVDTAAARREAAERHGRAILILASKLPPAERASWHWRLLPLHEVIGSAMTNVAEGEARNDEVAVSSGWIAFDRALRGLRDVVAGGK